MDPITAAILSWLTGEVGTAGVRIIGSLARGDRQQRALEMIVARSVDAAVDGVVADRERADVREALLRKLPQDTNAVGPGDILDLETAVSRVLGPRLELLQGQGYRIDSSRLTNTLARLIRQGIRPTRTGAARWPRWRNTYATSASRPRARQLQPQARRWQTTCRQSAGRS